MKMTTKFPPLSGLPMGEVFCIMGQRDGFSNVGVTLIQRAMEQGKDFVFMDYEASIDPEALKKLDIDLTDEPNQRGFMIGSVRL